mgnify:CR=1 FL=1
MPKEVVLSETKISRYNRTTVPEKGDEIEWVFSDGKTCIVKATSR